MKELRWRWKDRGEQKRKKEKRIGIGEGGIVGLPKSKGKGVRREGM